MESFKNLSTPAVIQDTSPDISNSTSAANNKSDSAMNILSRDRLKYLKKENQSSEIQPKPKIACWSKLKLDKWKKGHAAQFYNNFHENAKQLALMNTIYEFNVYTNI